MGRIHYLAVVLLLGTMVFSSCECNRTDPPIAEESPAFPDRASGFGVATKAKATATPRTPEVAPTDTPAADASPTEPIDARIPDDFPAEVQVYEGAELTLVQPTAGNGHNIVFRTDDDVETVNRFYRDDLQTKGWKVTQEFERGEHAFSTYRKGNTMINVTIASDADNPGKQVIAIMYYDEEPLPFDEF